jgi:hypothetical protein
MCRLGGRDDAARALARQAPAPWQRCVSVLAFRHGRGALLRARARARAAAHAATRLRAAVQPRGVWEHELELLGKRRQARGRVARGGEQDARVLFSGARVLVVRVCRQRRGAHVLQARLLAHRRLFALQLSGDWTTLCGGREHSGTASAPASVLRAMQATAAAVAAAEGLRVRRAAQPLRRAPSSALRTARFFSYAERSSPCACARRVSASARRAR